MLALNYIAHSILNIRTLNNILIKNAPTLTCPMHQGLPRYCLNNNGEFVNTANSNQLTRVERFQSGGT